MLLRDLTKNQVYLTAGLSYAKVHMLEVALLLAFCLRCMHLIVAVDSLPPTEGLPLFAGGVAFLTLPIAELAG